VFDGNNDQLTDKHGCLAYVSPEILDTTFSSATAAIAGSSNSMNVVRSYSGRAADMWSLGVMLYTMLVGRYPFADSDACALFSRIRRGKYPNPDVVLSPLALCLIRSLLDINPNDRLTAEEALKHPWFRAVETGSNQLISLSLSRCVEDGIVPHLSMEVDDDVASR
jgi:tribbles-like protein